MDSKTPMIEVSQRVAFHGVHTLQRPGEPGAKGSAEIHGHDYQAKIVLRGDPDPKTGMLVDIGALTRALAAVTAPLEGVILDDLPGLGPATIENMAIWIWNKLKNDWPQLHRVDVGREVHGDLARYWG